jgi:hypothetical protein
MHPPYQHYPARIEKDFDGRRLEGEACDPAEEVVGAQCRPQSIKGSLIRRNSSSAYYSVTGILP